MTLEARDLTLFLGKKHVLDGVSFTARAGALTAIVGPNGCGKTTTLKVVSGEIRRAAASPVRRALESFRPWELALRRGVLAQHTVIAFPFTVREIVGMGVTAGTGRWSPEAERHAIDRALEPSISRVLPAGSTRSFPAASSSACSSPVFSARSRSR